MSDVPARGPRRLRPWIIVVVGSLLVGGGLVWRAALVRRVREREARAAVALAQEQLRRGRPDLALRAVDGVAEDGPWQSGLLTVKGLASAAFDRPDETRSALERSLRLDPNQPMAAKVLAAVYLNEDDSERGLKMLGLAARLDPADFRPWFGAGDYRLRYLNRPADAISDFREALRRNPDHRESQLGLVKALIASGDSDAAGPLLVALLRDHADDPEVQRLAAQSANLRGQAEEMHRHLDEALALDPDDIEALVLRAQVHLKADRRGDALRDAERAVGQAPNDPRVLALLAQVENALGLDERASATRARRLKAIEQARLIDGLRQEIKARPDDPGLRVRLARLAAESGLIDIARASLRKALALDPTSVTARETLASLPGGTVVSDSAPRTELRRGGQPPAGPGPRRR